MSDQRITGKKAEDVACSFLLRNGLTLVQEITIVAMVR